MDSFWSKILVVLLVIAGAVVLARRYLPSRQKLKPQPQKSYQDVVREDDRRLRSEPDFNDIRAAEPNRPAVRQLKEKIVAEPKPQPKPKFKELSEVETIEAERLFEFAIQQRKMGRLPYMAYGPMVDACRQIIQKFGGSEFDYKARRMLSDIPRRYRQRYKITEEEIDLAGFYK